MKAPGLAVLREAGSRWVSDRCDRLGAALAFYAMFSLFPLLLLSITALGYALGNSATARARVVQSLAGMEATPEVRSLLDDTLASLQAHSAARGVGAVVGVVSLLFSASGVFSELSASLNTIWRVEEPGATTLKNKVVALLRDRVLAFAVVLVAGVAILASLALGTALTAMNVTGAGPTWFLASSELVLSTVVLAALLATMFRVLPHTRVEWADVVGGASLAALGLSIFRRLLGLYLGRIGDYAAYGVVGGVLAMMLFIYVSALVTFFGAEVARVHAERRESRREATRAPPGGPLT